LAKIAGLSSIKEMVSHDCSIQTVFSVFASDCHQSGTKGALLKEGRGWLSNIMLEEKLLEIDWS